MITFKVNTQNEYKIVVADDYGRLAETVKEDKICIVSDKKVALLYLKTVSKALLGKQIFSFAVDEGEKSKSFESYKNLLTFLAENDFSRGDALIALGGGVVGDLTGFVASTYMRGIAYYQVPTSLIGMIDSSVGGKTGIDLPCGKNLIGTFYQPSGVYINVSALNTLSVDEMSNGLGEYVKYAYLSDTVCCKNVKNGINRKMIADCLKVKIKLVEEDEKDCGNRMLLNLGHTVGHAVETLSCFTLAHGVCVAKGIAAALNVSKNYYRMPDEKYERLKSLLNEFDFDLTVPFKKEEIISQIIKDKKYRGGVINFVTIFDIGDCRVQKFTLEELARLL